MACIFGVTLHSDDLPQRIVPNDVVVIFTHPFVVATPAVAVVAAVRGCCAPARADDESADARAEDEEVQTAAAAAGAAIVLSSPVPAAPTRPLSPAAPPPSALAASC
jgi:hypothetical protein